MANRCSLRPCPLLEQRELLMRGGAAAVARRSALTPVAFTGRALTGGAPTPGARDSPASRATRPADAVPLGKLADLGADSCLIVLARVGAAPVQLGVPRDQIGVRLAEPAEEPFAGAGPQVQDDRHDVRRSGRGDLPDRRV